MALIKCPECGNMISDKAAVCPKCGIPIEEIKKILEHQSDEKETIVNSQDVGQEDNKQHSFKTDENVTVESPKDEVIKEIPIPERKGEWKPKKKIIILSSAALSVLLLVVLLIIIKPFKSNNDRDRVLSGGDYWLNNSFSINLGNNGIVTLCLSKDGSFVENNSFGVESGKFLVNNNQLILTYSGDSDDKAVLDIDKENNRIGKNPYWFFRDDPSKVKERLSTYVKIGDNSNFIELHCLVGKKERNQDKGVYFGTSTSNLQKETCSNCSQSNNCNYYLINNVSDDQIYYYKAYVSNGQSEKISALNCFKVVKGSLWSPTFKTTNTVILDNVEYFEHLVLNKQTLYSISNTYNVSMDEILDANPGVDKEHLLRYSILKIPNVPSVAEPDGENEDYAQEDGEDPEYIQSEQYDYRTWTGATSIAELKKKLPGTSWYINVEGLLYEFEFSSTTVKVYSTILRNSNGRNEDYISSPYSIGQSRDGQGNAYASVSFTILTNKIDAGFGMWNHCSDVSFFIGPTNCGEVTYGRYEWSSL
jgi:LysM repeat protein